MLPAIAQHAQELRAACERFSVARLELFGSATDERFDAEKSDLDFLVTFRDLSPGEHAHSYFGLLEALESLFGRKVDLVVTAAIRNPYFLQGIASSRTLLYAA